MKFLSALTIALLFSLISPAFCQDGPDIFPDEHTRKIARELDLKTVKEVYISGEGGDLTLRGQVVVAADSVPPNVDARSILHLFFHVTATRKRLSVQQRSAARRPPLPFRL